MKRRYGTAAIRMAMTLLLVLALPITALAGKSEWVNGGYFSNFDSLTWTANDGTVTTYGRGPKFSDTHPDVTDPEYYLKEAVQYPYEGGDAVSTYDSQGRPKVEYAPETVEELRKFVNSFDWIHSDELTRATMVFNKIGNGMNGNRYDTNGVSGYEGEYRVLRTGIGICENFSDEFCGLARFVGLKCETYMPSAMHQACLLKINGYWFAVDPTSGNPIYSNDATYPVDYETEYNRYANETDAKMASRYEENSNDLAARLYLLNNQLAAGEITREQYETQCSEIEQIAAGTANNQ